MKSIFKNNANLRSLPHGRGISKFSPLFVTLLMLGSLLYAQAGLAGHWEAEVTGDGSQKIQVSLDLAKNAKSEWMASMGLPANNMTGLVVKDVSVASNAVKFVAVELMMTPFDLALTPEGTLKGTISGRAAQPVTFKRTGEPKVELIPASPAVSKQLEGEWEGSLQTPRRPIPMVFHFKNQADNTVMATFGTGNAADLPLNDVKQTGQTVEFGMRVAHGRFNGILNKQGTELAGKLTHEETSVPLTLRKHGAPAGKADNGDQPTTADDASPDQP